jgi:hypothetical protein
VSLQVLRLPIRPPGIGHGSPFQRVGNLGHRLVIQGVARRDGHAGGVDDYDEVFINGQSIGSTTTDGAWNQERVYTLPAGLLKPGRNVIAVRVRDAGGFGGLWRRPLRIGPHIPADFQPIKR